MSLGLEGAHSRLGPSLGLEEAHSRLGLEGHTRVRAGRCSCGTIVFSREKMDLSRKSHRSEKKNNRIKRVLKNIGTISKRMERKF